MERFVEKLGEKLWGNIVWNSWVEILVGNLGGKIGWKAMLKYTVYSVQCTMYNKVAILSLLREPQCSSVWRVKPFAHKVPP